MTACHNKILSSVGAPLTPDGGSACSFLKSRKSRRRAWVDIAKTCQTKKKQGPQGWFWWRKFGGTFHWFNLSNEQIPERLKNRRSRRLKMKEKVQLRHKKARGQGELMDRYVRLRIAQRLSTRVHARSLATRSMAVWHSGRLEGGMWCYQLTYRTGVESPVAFDPTLVTRVLQPLIDLVAPFWSPTFWPIFPLLEQL
jgi:hypothetical protein